MRRSIFAALAMATLAWQPAQAQTGGETATRINPDNPETWVLEYHAMLTPFVEGYYNCLKSRGTTIGAGVASFEAQHRADIPQCATRASQLETEAKSLVARRPTAETSPQDVERLFEKIRQVHVARGHDLDSRLRRRVVEAPAQPELTPEERREAELCVAQVRRLVAERQSYAEDRGFVIAAIHAKSDYTDEDRRAIFEYQGTLARYTDRIAFEMRRCPQSQHADQASL